MQGAEKASRGGEKRPGKEGKSAAKGEPPHRGKKKKRKRPQGLELSRQPVKTDEAREKKKKKKKTVRKGEKGKVCPKNLHPYGMEKGGGEFTTLGNRRRTRKTPSGENF